MPTDVDVEPTATVAAMVRARATDDQVGLVYGDQTWTWRQVVGEAAVRAAWLRAVLDPARPPHVGVLLPNVPEYVFEIFGAALAGACIVGLNSTRPAAELARDIGHTDCQLVIADGTYAGLVDDPLRIEDAPWADHAGAPLPDTDPPRSALMCLLFTSGSTSAQRRCCAAGDAPRMPQRWDFAPKTRSTARCRCAMETHCPRRCSRRWPEGRACCCVTASRRRHGCPTSGRTM